MQRILVIADTNGHLDAAREAIKSHGPWDHIVHLGDSMLDAVDLSVEMGLDIAAIRGNNEYEDSPEYGDRLVFEVDGVSFYAIHGHELDLGPSGADHEDGLARLSETAKEAHADVALFGHTHVHLIKEGNGVMLINPGSIGSPDGKKTFAEIRVSDGKIEEARIIETG